MLIGTGAFIAIMPEEQANFSAHALRAYQRDPNDPVPTELP